MSYPVSFHPKLVWPRSVPKLRKQIMKQFSSTKHLSRVSILLFLLTSCSSQQRTVSPSQSASYAATSLSLRKALEANQPKPLLLSASSNIQPQINQSIFSRSQVWARISCRLSHLYSLAFSPESSPNGATK